MGNKFGFYVTKRLAVSDLIRNGFNQDGEVFTKPSFDGYGFPRTAIVRITETMVSGEYTLTGKDEVYFQHEWFL